MAEGLLVVRLTALFGVLDTMGFLPSFSFENSMPESTFSIWLSMVALAAMVCLSSTILISRPLVASFFGLKKLGLVNLRSETVL